MLRRPSAPPTEIYLIPIPLSASLSLSLPFRSWFSVSAHILTVPPSTVPPTHDSQCPSCRLRLAPVEPFALTSSWYLLILLGRTVRAAAAPSHRGREQPHFFFICDDNLVQTHERVTFSPPPPSPPSPHPARDRRFHRDLDERGKGGRVRDGRTD